MPRRLLRFEALHRAIVLALGERDLAFERRDPVRFDAIVAVVMRSLRRKVRRRVLRVAGTNLGNTAHQARKHQERMPSLVVEHLLGGTHVVERTRILLLFEEQPRRRQERARVHLGVVIVTPASVEHVHRLAVSPYARQQERLVSKVRRLALESFVVASERRQGKAPAKNRVRG